MKSKEAEKRLQSLIGKDLQEVRLKLGISNTGPKGGLKLVKIYLCCEPFYILFF